jgi:hypothetical protein
MKAHHTKFILQLLVISVLMYAGLYLVFSRWFIVDIPLLFMIAFLFVMNSLAYILTTNTRDKKPQRFVFTFMAISLGKMVACALFVVWYALTHQHHSAKAFALTFFLAYFIYTLVEVMGLAAFFRVKKQ